MKNKGCLIAGIVLVVIIGFLGMGACSSYNGMVDLSQAVDRQWGQVQNQYQRRADLIPNLVSTVKGYAEHESSTLESVTNARAGLSKAYENAEALKGDQQNNLQQYQQAQSALKGALDIYVNAVREAYPDLKANTNFLDLQSQLEGTENRIATERKRYNEEVERYNVKVMRFPTNIFAGMFGFHKRDMFAADAAAQTAPKVEF